MGAILFLTYVNDFPAKRTHSDTTSYVDDNTDTTKDKNINMLKIKAQEEGDYSYEWLKANGLALSSNKTKLLYVAKKKKINTR